MIRRLCEHCRPDDVRGHDLREGVHVESRHRILAPAAGMHQTCLGRAALWAAGEPRRIVDEELKGALAEVLRGLHSLLDGRLRPRNSRLAAKRRKNKKKHLKSSIETF